MLTVIGDVELVVDVGQAFLELRRRSCDRFRVSTNDGLQNSILLHAAEIPAPIGRTARETVSSGVLR